MMAADGKIDPETARPRRDSSRKLAPLSARDGRTGQSGQYGGGRSGHGSRSRDGVASPSRGDAARASPPSRAAWLPFGALALLALIWGYNWVVMKVSTRYSDPFTFAALRTLMGAVFMFGVVALLRRPLRPKGFWLVVLFGVLQTGGFVGLIMWAVYEGGAGKASVLAYTMPFWLLLIAWPALGERVRGIQWTSVVLALAGLIFVLGPWNIHGLFSSLLAVGAGVVWAVASVIVKILRTRHEIDLLSLVAWQGLFGSVPLIAVALLTVKSGPTWSASFIAALLFNVIPANALTWVLWLYLLHALPIGTAAISSLAVPVVGVIAAWIQLGERPGAMEGIGMGLIVAALALLTARELRRGAAPAPSRAAVPALQAVAAERSRDPEVDRS